MAATLAAWAFFRPPPRMEALPVNGAEVRIVPTEPLISIASNRPLIEAFTVPRGSVGVDMAFPDGAIVLRGERSLSGVDLSTGRVWTRTCHEAGFLRSNGPFVLVFENEERGWRLTRINARTGSVLWEISKTVRPFQFQGAEQLGIFLPVGKPFVIENYLVFGFGAPDGLQIAAVNCRNGQTKTGGLQECASLVPALKKTLFAVGATLVWDGQPVPLHELPRGAPSLPLVVGDKGVIASYSTDQFLSEGANRGFALLATADLTSGVVRDSLEGAASGPKSHKVGKVTVEVSYLPPCFWTGSFVYANRAEVQVASNPADSIESLAVLTGRSKTFEVAAPASVRQYWPTTRGLVVEDVKGTWWKVNGKAAMAIALNGRIHGVSPYGMVVTRTKPDTKGSVRVRFSRI